MEDQDLPSEVDQLHQQRASLSLGRTEMSKFQQQKALTTIGSILRFSKTGTDSCQS